MEPLRPRFSTCDYNALAPAAHHYLIAPSSNGMAAGNAFTPGGLRAGGVKPGKGGRRTQLDKFTHMI
jgi:hypothetical protein